MTKIFSPGRIQADGNLSLRLTLKSLQKHVAIAGGTGMGKTMLLILIALQAITQGIGVTFVTPHPDAIRFLLDWLSVNMIDPSRVIHFKPSPERCPSSDPFADQPRGVSFVAYECWLTGVIDQIFAAFVRNCSASEQELMKRLRRWFFCAAYLCGLDRGGWHAGLGKLPALLDPQHAEFDELVDGAKPYIHSEIGREVIADFEKLRNTPQARQQEGWVESTLNLKYTVFSTLFRLIIGQHAPSLSQRDVILGNKVQLVDMSKGRMGLSREQGNIVGGMLINQLIDAAEKIADGRDEDELVDHMLIIDEFENYLGEDVRKGFTELRKFKLRLVIAYQDRSCLMKGELDLGNKIVSQCGLQITFQQQSPDDIEYLAQAFGYGSLDLTPLLVDQVLPDGYDWVPTESLSVTENSTWNVGDAKSLSRTFSQTRQRHTAEAISEQVALALSSSESEGTSRTNTYGEADAYSVTESLKLDVARSHTENNSESTGTNDQRSNSSGRTQGTGEVRGSSESETLGRDFRPSSQMSGDNHSKSLTSSQVDTISSALATTNNKTSGASDGITVTNGGSRSDGTSHTDNESRAYGSNCSKSNGLTLTLGGGVSRTEGNSVGASSGESTGATHSESKGGGTSRGRTTQLTPLQRVKIQRLPSGKLVIAREDQLAAVMKLLATLPEQIVLCKAQGMGSPFIVRVHDVRDPYEQKGMFRSRAFREAMRKRYLERVYAAHPFYFVPKDEDAGACRCAADCTCAAETVENPYD